jgi:N utilization substance protein B
VGARRRARELAFRVIFQCEASGDAREGTALAVLEESGAADDVREYVLRIVDTYGRNAVAVESAIRDASRRWKLERMAATDRGVLKVAAVELMYFGDVPARVILDEAVEIARKFGSDESGGFVNGILDSVARAFRREEFTG